MRVSQLFIYPIKSLGGIAVDAASIQPRGFQYDRRWMLVDENHRFITQREYPELALLKTDIKNGQLIIAHKNHPEQSIAFPVELDGGDRVAVTIFDDHCEALLSPAPIHEWFSTQLKMRCKLVYMPDDSLRPVEQPYAKHNEITSFSDAYPVLIIGQASLDELNSRLTEKLPINRFRPNIVFTGGHPFEEDELEEFRISDIHFFGVKLCARCVIPTINQDSAVKHKEPTKTLSTYRMRNNKIYFGQNLLHQGSGAVHVNDTIDVLKRKEPVFTQINIH